MQEDEVGVIMERLREELEASAARGDQARGATSAARREAGRLACLTLDRPFPIRHGLSGALRRGTTTPVKVVLRKLMRWYLQPLVADQRRFNELSLRLVDELTERLRAQEEELAQLRQVLGRPDHPAEQSAAVDVRGQSRR